MSEQQKYREQEMLRQCQHKWYKLSLQPVWTKHTLSTETQEMVTQCSALESQLRSLVRGKGTAAERMVKSFRAALHSFRVLARGHALRSVQSGIHRELNGGQHSDSMTREYCTGTAHWQRIGLTDYCMCGTAHVFRESKQVGNHCSPRIAAGTISTTVGAVLTKHSIRWHIRRQVYTKWLHWRERHLLTVQQMAADAVATSTLAPSAAAPQGTMTNGTAVSEDAVTEAAVAEGAAAKQHCTPDSSNYSVQLMATFASVHRVWEQNWSLIVASDHSERADISASCRKHGTALEEVMREKNKAMVSCKGALQQLQEAQQRQRSNKQTDTPMELMQQYHPVEATAFRQAAESREGMTKDGVDEGSSKYRVKGFVELANEEASKRSASVQEARKIINNHYSEHDIQWQRRAQETSAMAQQFGQAAADAVSAIETAFSSQEWDHRMVMKQHNPKLAAMETALEMAQNEMARQLSEWRSTHRGEGSDRMRHFETYHKVEACKEALRDGTRAEEERAFKTRKFMRKITLLDMTAQFVKSKAIISSRGQVDD